MSVLINLSALLDDAKCFELVRQTRWPQGVRCPKCCGEHVVRNGHDDTQPHRQRYLCNDCQFRFDDLSDTALADFCVFFLETMLDQIQFMSDLLGLPALRTRVERYFQFEALHLDRYREEIMRVARTLVDEGEIPRARVQEITGKAATVSVEIIKLGLEQGYFETPSPKGPLRVAFPAKIHEFYFPQLFLDLPVEPPAGRAA